MRAWREITLLYVALAIYASVKTYVEGDYPFWEAIAYGNFAAMVILGIMLAVLGLVSFFFR